MQNFSKEEISFAKQCSVIWSVGFRISMENQGVQEYAFLTHKLLSLLIIL